MLSPGPLYVCCPSIHQVQAQVAACLLRRGTIRFDSRVGINVVSSLVRGMGQVMQTPLEPILLRYSPRFLEIKSTIREEFPSRSEIRLTFFV